MSAPSSPIDSGNKGLAALSTIQTLDALKIPSRSKSFPKHLPAISESRLNASSSTSAPSALFPSEKEPPTVLYLAYGSNLSAETFQGKRGIRPLAATNVVVPSLVMTFDLPGLPYAEPCFANTAFRSTTPPPSSPTSPTSLASPTFHTSPQLSEKTPFLSFQSPEGDDGKQPPYHKDRWPHGLVGVVYEVRPQDYAHIIATEGGGASYHDITVPCYPLPRGTRKVPEHPTTTPFLAHTLFAPANPSDENTLSATPVIADNAAAWSGMMMGEGVEKGKDKAEAAGRLTRPNPSYAQPSARYLRLITTGAAEHAFPPDYTAYLDSLRPYTITSTRQRLGQFIFLWIWAPIVAWLFFLAKGAGGGKGGREGDGKSPKWVVWLTGKVFESMWMFYDGGFRDVFGDGERTEKRSGDGEGEVV